MPPEQTDLKYVWDMLDAARNVDDMARDRSLEEYVQNTMLRLAVERGIEIIGEAARRVSEPFRAQYPSVPWSAIVATRHIIAHEYGELQHDKLWRMATVHVPALIVQLTPIIEANPPQP